MKHSLIYSFGCGRWGHRPRRTVLAGVPTSQQHHSTYTKSFLFLLIIYSAVCITLTGFKSNYNHAVSHYYNKHSINNNDTTPPLPSFLVVSDIHLYSSLQQQDSFKAIAKTITINDNGDTGNDLWDSTKFEIRKLIKHNKPKFIIVLGDLQRHNLPVRNDPDSNFEKILTFFGDKRAISSTIPVIYAAGNNDSWNGDYDPFSIPNFIYTNYKYPYANVSSALVATHACIANNSLQKELDCFSLYPLGTKYKLKLIVLNTVIFTVNKTYSLTKPRQQTLDADKQLAWLRKELAHTKSDESVLIAMHIPPGIDGYTKTRLPKKYMWDESLQFEGRTIQNAFIDITDSFKNIIGILASHSHMDGIRLLQKDSATISSLIISIPGIAPGHRNNPAMKIITYNPEKKFALQDFTTFYMKYWDGKSSGSLKSWDSLYTFKSMFPYHTHSSMLAGIKEAFKKNKKNAIDSLVNNIYTVNNGAPSVTSNDAKLTIYVGKQ